MIEIIESIKNKIIKATTYQDYIKGLNFPKSNIKLQSKSEFSPLDASYLFQIKSTSRHYYYFTKINIENNEIEFSLCTCPQCELTGSCKHIAAALINYSNIMFTEKTKEELKKISKDVFSSYIDKNSSRKIKKEVFVDYKITRSDNYWRDEFIISLKIGINKMYTLSSKLRSFLNAYISDEEYRLGKDFTYDPDSNYFSKENEEILTFLYNISEYNCQYGIYLDEKDMKKILPLLKGRSLIYQENIVDEIKNGSPFDINLSKEDDLYTFKIETKDNSVEPLTNDYEYSYKSGKIYHIKKQLRSLISDMKQRGLENLIFDENDLNSFSNSILPIVKNEINIDSSIDNIIIGITPSVKMYFDLNRDNIVCNLKFIYNDNEVEYFKKDNKNILRDVNFESDVVNDLIINGFTIENNKIYIDDIDYIGDFLDIGLEELSKKYEVFTSQNIKNINLNKNNKVATNFSLGQDNIMRYEFKIDNVTDNELDDILKSLKKKKKYFKLKSGDLISLENEQLKELSNLTDELDMDYKDIKANGGELPKYYALYLDSLKKNKYKIINTNNLFDNFIHDFKKYQNVDIKFDKFEKETLRDYQFEGVKWLYTIHKCGFGGILADEMGLGKSLQTIIFIKKILKDDPNSKFLIVVPTSLLYNWKNEFNKFSPDIKLELVSGNKTHREELLNKFNKTVYVTTYGLLREDIEFYMNKNFKACIIDEAQNIKNPKAGTTKSVKKIKAQTKLALTGTPIENSVIELWSIFDYIMPGFLSSLVKFQGKYKINDFDDETNALIEKLNKQVRPFILRRKKVDVAKDLPDKIENNIYIDLSEKEMKLYAAEVKRVQREIDERVQSEGFSKARFEILKLITRLRQLCIDPKILYENFKDTSSKIENLMKVVGEVIDNGHKILLFTSFKTALDIVRKEFSNNNITSYTIDGSVSSKKRMELVDKFNSDDTNVFLIMLKSGGTGLNLTSADVVIHLDLWWNPQAENQATDRTHRIGQTKTVEVIKLIAKGTIEEKILELQKKKQLLSDKLIESDNPDSEIFKKLTEDDIKGLLAFENKE